MYLFKDNRKIAIQNGFCFEILKKIIMKFDSDVPQKFSYSKEQNWFFILRFNFFQRVVPQFILLKFFICIPLETKLGFT